jgi:hypothetical protein
MALQLEAQQILKSIPSDVHQTTIEDLVDSGYICREMSNIADDLRKSCDDKKNCIGHYLAARAAVSAIQDDELLALRGELATATTDISVKPKLPKEGSKEYVDLMRWLGVSDEQINSSVLRPSFSGIQEILTERAKDGKQPPPGISVTFTEATVVFRKKKGSNGQEDE